MENRISISDIDFSSKMSELGISFFFRHSKFYLGAGNLVPSCTRLRLFKSNSIFFTNSLTKIYLIKAKVGVTIVLVISTRSCIGLIYAGFQMFFTVVFTAMTRLSATCFQDFWMEY
ncbi:uncharacterized protein BX663DRAFT_546005 [Cokeromyces recurvatus]|uniref:uncharacterized protein n=1 Tax=Cokeromyces recurvatus TaxID=90255 RepID=UPI0022207EE5|nr:uncharacterized protein BX663DRAFT_546005 [Cokeromyces recurvatus]KAI7899013.1 hypothetical protein BX663DRAFT_546005 [Cokeromyces recurvatus]